MSFILGTAGHIDHGKTTLVRALTGIDCDRLGEEKKRGITIELGFAWLDLGNGDRLGIVDVPGHERFVKNMVAGAAGIDMVMLVIAADEGVMPQTREHLEICSLLGIREGFVVLTKKDMVDADWLGLVKEDVRNFLRGSFLENAPVLTVSAVTGEGIPELKDYIIRRVASLTPPRRPDIFRLPIDRCFSLKGHGTVVTGTVISGSVRHDSDAAVMPENLPVHIRTLQRHGRDAEEVDAGERCAANLQNVEVQDVSRGSTLALPGTLFPSSRWIVRLRMLKDAPHALRHQGEVHFHHGTREMEARLHFFGEKEVLSGAVTLAEVRFSEPEVAVFGDHCVIRAGVPLRAAAGCLVLSPLPPEIRRSDPQREHRLALLAGLAELADQGTPESDAELLSAVLELRGSQGATRALLKVLTGLTSKRLDRAVQTLSSKKKAVCFDRTAQGWISAPDFARLGEACLKRAAELHRADPLKPGYAQVALGAGWSQALSPKLVQKVFEDLLRQGKLIQAGDVLCLPGHEVILDESQQKLREAMLGAFRKGGLTPPNLSDVIAAAGSTEKAAAALLRVLVRDKEIYRVSDSLYYSKEAVEEIRGKVTEWFKTHDDLSVAGMKELLGLSRKFIIPLLEFLDQEKITVRIGDKRQLRSR